MSGDQRLVPGTEDWFRAGPLVGTRARFGRWAGAHGRYSLLVSGDHCSELQRIEEKAHDRVVGELTMGQIPLHYVDLRTFCYVTEDEKRVEEALRFLLPEETPIDRTESEGHYGDRILVLSARVENADDVRYVLSKLASGAEIDRLIDELDDRVTENTELFLRLDKQAAFNGRVELGAGITFRGKVEAYPAKKPQAVENAREVLDRLVDEQSDSA